MVTATKTATLFYTNLMMLQIHRHV